MIETKVIGFVIGKTKYQDFDEIINIETESGIKTFKGRGLGKINSKNAPSCNFFVLGEYLLTAKTELSNATLKSASIIKQYKRPYDDLLTSATYLFICSLLSQLKDVSGFDLGRLCFDYLEKGVYPINVLNYFLKKMCISLGYETNLSGCIGCKKRSDLISFSLEDGGFICKNCLSEYRYQKMNVNLLKAIYSFLKEDGLCELSEKDSLDILKIYLDFIKNNVGLNVNNKDFIYKCL